MQNVNIFMLVIRGAIQSLGPHNWDKMLDFELQCVLDTQYNLNASNTDGSFTVDDSNSFFSPYKIIPIAQENKYLGIFPYFIMELYVVCTH